MASGEINSFEGWIKGRTLGKGAFGRVTLWEHEVTLIECIISGGLARVARWRSPPGPPYNFQNHHPFKAWPRPTGPFRAITPPQKKCQSAPVHS